MRIFVLGAGATGSLLAQLLARQGHIVACGDRDPERARLFLGKKSPLPVSEVNARNLWVIVRAARGCHLLVNAGPAVLNEIVLRAALRLRAHYLDMSAHLTRHIFKAEQLRFHKRFQEKNRSEEHTSELQSPCNLVCRLLLEKKKKTYKTPIKTRRRNQQTQADIYTSTSIVRTT